MSLTRKEFLRQGAASLGRAALELTAVLQGSAGETPAVRPQDEAPEPPLEPGAHLVAQPQGTECMAASCGCLTCLERCEPQAISFVFGQGIQIDPTRCTGCAVCVDLCPTTPRSLAMVPRSAEKAPAA